MWLPSPACSRGPGARADELQCGTHAPGFYELRGEVPPPPPYSPLAHNCSGKHSGMLAYCVHCGLPKESYLDSTTRCSRRSGARSPTSPARPRSDLVAGIDGCSAPNYALPLSGLARAYARLAARRRRRRRTAARRASSPTR